MNSALYMIKYNFRKLSVEFKYKFSTYHKLLKINSDLCFKFNTFSALFNNSALFQHFFSIFQHLFSSSDFCLRNDTVINLPISHFKWCSWSIIAPFSIIYKFDYTFFIWPLREMVFDGQNSIYIIQNFFLFARNILPDFGAHTKVSILCHPVLRGIWLHLITKNSEKPQFWSIFVHIF